MMTDLSLSAMAQPATPPAPPQKAGVRSGADLQTPTATTNTAQYLPLPTTPTDAFTPSEAGTPADASATVPAGTEKPKGGFDPIAGGVGVAGIAVVAGLLAFLTKGDKLAKLAGDVTSDGKAEVAKKLEGFGHHFKESSKLFLGAGLGVAATLLAPMGGNLVKDLYKKNSAPPADPTAAATNPALATGAVVPPTIDPMTGLPQPVQQQPVGAAYPPVTTTTLPGVTA
jgi:hypothetical protein